MLTEKQKCNVAIVGCGLGGVATAIAIRRAGHSVTVLEQASGPNEIGAGIQLPYNCTRILGRWGILPAVESYATRPSSVILRSYKDGRVLFRRLIPVLADGGSETAHLLLHRADFLKTLVGEAVRLGVLLRFGATVTKIEFDKPAIQLSDGEEYQYDVIFGADGSKSFCRGLLFGRSQGPQLSGDVAYRMIIPVSEIKKVEELLPLIEGSDISCWMGPDAHVICYQLKEGGMLNVVLNAPCESSWSANNTSSEGQEVDILFENWDPLLRRLFRLAKDILKRRIQGSHEMSSWSHPCGRFALVGDACHTSLPHLAQGAAQAIEDGAVLGELFARIEEKSQIKDIIKLYEAIRKPRTARVIAASDLMKYKYQMRDGEAQQQRDQELTENKSLERYPKCMENPEFQSWLLAYDTGSEVETAWQQYQALRHLSSNSEHADVIMQA